MSESVEKQPLLRPGLAWEGSPGSRAAARAIQLRAQAAKFLRRPGGLIGCGILFFTLSLAIAGPWLLDESSFLNQSLSERLQPPSGLHLFGTDELGRDVFARVVVASRVTLSIVTMVSLIVLPLGLIIGMTAAYLGGFADSCLMRLTDTVLAFPRLILALALAAAMGPGLYSIVLAIALTSWPVYARLARAETLVVRNSDFVVAARLQGASTSRILSRHILPFCLSSTVVRLTLDMSGIVLTAAGLGFLGLGIQPPEPEWGSMVAAGRDFLVEQWWIAAFPGVAILILSLGFNLAGEALRDVLTPRTA